MKWKIDCKHTVHTHWCEEDRPGALPYNVKVLTASEMLDNVASQDYKDNHHGDNILSACRCVADMARIEEETKNG